MGRVQRTRRNSGVREQRYRDREIGLVARDGQPRYCGRKWARLARGCGIQTEHCSMAASCLDCTVWRSHAFQRFPPQPISPMNRTFVLSQNYSAVTAACMVLRKTVFDELRGFDENLPSNFNDVDFCLRVREARFANCLDALCRFDPSRIRIARA